MKYLIWLGVIEIRLVPYWNVNLFVQLPLPEHLDD